MGLRFGNLVYLWIGFQSASHASPSTSGPSAPPGWTPSHSTEVQIDVYITTRVTSILFLITATILRINIASYLHKKHILEIFREHTLEWFMNIQIKAWVTLRRTKVTIKTNWHVHHFLTVNIQIMSIYFCKTVPSSACIKTICCTSTHSSQCMHMHGKVGQSLRPIPNKKEYRKLGPLLYIGRFSFPCCGYYIPSEQLIIN